MGSVVPHGLALLVLAPPAEVINTVWPVHLGCFCCAGVDLSDEEGGDELPPEQLLSSDALLRGHISE